MCNQGEWPVNSATESIPPWLASAAALANVTLYDGAPESEMVF